VASLQRLVVPSAQWQAEGLYLLPHQSHYLTHVLRLRLGQHFVAMDGQGRCWLAVLTPNPAQAKLVEAIALTRELPIPITLMAALPKGNGFDGVVRQATELGATCIAPIWTDRTLLNPSAHKLNRWRRLAQEAAEQAERSLVPEILEPIPLIQALEVWNPSVTSQRYCCVARADSPHLLSCLQSQDWGGDRRPLVLAIGPEGGWTPEELEQAIVQDYQLVSLGRPILRAVTAPLVALSLLAAAVEQQAEGA